MKYIELLSKKGVKLIALQFRWKYSTVWGKFIK
jgi:hypothetical protein